MIAVFAAWVIAASGGDAAQAAAQPPAPAAAPTPAQGAQAAAQPPKKRGDERICWEETPTGTRFSHRVCATRAEIDERRRHDQDWKMQGPSSGWGLGY
jgi:hypothetical protein